MRLTTYLDFDLVALEQDDQLTLMLELSAPAPATRAVREPAALEVVLDRSGSMSGTRLRTAQRALDRLVGWLDERDRFGLVAFDGDVEVLVPAGVLSDKAGVREAIARIEPGAGSNLSFGYARGLTEAGWTLDGTGATVLLISDGAANLGIDSPGELEQRAATARERGITTTTLALGPDAEHRLLSAIAHGGVGAALSATRPEVAAALLAGEIDGLLQPAVQSVALELHRVAGVSSIDVLGDVPVTEDGDRLVLELGDLYRDEMRRLVFSVALDAIDRPGAVKVADVTLQYVTLPSLVPHTFELPLEVTVVPAPRAVPRAANPIVISEAALQQVQQATARIARVRDTGATSPAAHALAASAAELARVVAAAPDDMRLELAQAICWLDESVVRKLMPRLLPSLRQPEAPPRT